MWFLQELVAILKFLKVSQKSNNDYSNDFYTLVFNYVHKFKMFQPHRTRKK